MMNMKIKNIFLIAFVVICFLTAISLSSAGVYSYEWVKVSLISQTPDPVEPGSLVDVRVKIENLGSEAAEDFKFEIIPEYPFSLYHKEDKVKKLGSLSAGDVYGVYYKYKIKVDEDAVEGTNELKFRYKYKGTNWVTVGFNINIQSPDAIVWIKQVKTVPEIISHGEKAKILFTLKNIADSLIRDISLNLDLSSSTLPISPLNTGSEKRIKFIKSGQETEIDFDIITLATADSKVYKIPLTLSYSDEIGKNYSKTDVVSIIVSSKPYITYYIDESEILFPETNGKISVKIVNKGPEDIKFVAIKLKDSNDFVKLSNDEVYVGNIDSDDYETAEFDLYVKPKVTGLDLPLIIEYKDSINRDYEEEISLPVKLYSKIDAKKYKLITERTYLGWIIVVIIAVGGYLIYRRYKKKRKK